MSVDALTSIKHILLSSATIIFYHFLLYEAYLSCTFGNKNGILLRELTCVCSGNKRCPTLALS
jgi:hypothetical protein